MYTVSKLLVVFVVITSLGACASSSKTYEQDPYESFNRKVFSFNDKVDRHILKPVAKVYDRSMPEQANKSVTNFFSNLGDVPGAVNALLQVKPKKAAADSARFLINTTVGVVGFFDVASRWGIKSSDEDFGQTLERWGVASGPYIVWPFLGGRTVRDTVSLGVDTYLNPLHYVDDINTTQHYALRGVQLVDLRADLLEAETLLSGDRYSLFREAYTQRRKLLINDGEVVDDFGEDAFEDDIFDE